MRKIFFIIIKKFCENILQWIRFIADRIVFVAIGNNFFVVKNIKKILFCINNFVCNRLLYLTKNRMARLLGIAC